MGLMKPLTRLAVPKFFRGFATVNPGKSSMTQEEYERWQQIQDVLQRETLKLNYRNRGYVILWRRFLYWGCLLSLLYLVMTSVQFGKDPKGRLKIMLVTRRAAERFARTHLAGLRDMFPDEVYSDDDERFESVKGTEFLDRVELLGLRAARPLALPKRPSKKIDNSL